MKIDFSDEDIQEFRIEAQDLIELAEQHLLALDQGGDFKKNFDAIFRVFHSIKGTGGALGWTSLQDHFHQLESQFLICKPSSEIEKRQITYFLQGLDASRVLLNQGQINFDYENFTAETSPTHQVSEPQTKVEAHSSPSVASPNPTSVTPVALSEPHVVTAPPPSALAALPTAEGILSSENFLAYIIDDEPELVEILAEFLNAAGFETVGFTRPEEALAAIRNKKPDLVLSDMRMPGMSGLDVLKRVQEIDSDLAMIFISGQLTKDVIIEAVSHGIFGIIEKPFSGGNVVAVATAAARKTQLTRLLDRTVALAMYQFSTLEEVLAAKGKDDVRARVAEELQSVLKIKRKLKALRRKA